MRFTRFAAAAAAAGCIVGGSVMTAHADDIAPAPLPAADTTKATQVATQGKGIALARRVAELQAAGVSSPVKGFGKAQKQDTPDFSDAPVDVLDGTTTQVNVLSPEFVAQGRGPVGRLGYVANTVQVDDQVVTVWSAKKQNGEWVAVNAAAGDTEAQFGRRAAGGQVLSEPQINAWYAVKAGRVLPLNDEARAAVGNGVSLAEYQRLVHGKYADKMPGSTYDRQGMAGGFGQPAQAAAPAAAPAQESGSSAGLLAGAGVLGAAGIAGVGLARRRYQAQA